jgi:hypothetical protein
MLTVLAFPDAINYGFGDFVELYYDTGTGPAGTAPYVYSWSPAANILDPHATDTFAQPSATTIYTLTRVDALGAIETGSVLVTVNGAPANPPLSVEATATPSGIDLGQSSALEAVAVGGVPPLTYLWTPALGLSAPTSPTPTASPTVTTDYSVTVADAVGQTATTSVHLLVMVPEVPPAPAVVADLPAPGTRHRQPPGGASLYVTASGQVSRSNGLGPTFTVAHPTPGVYVITAAPGYGRALAAHHPALTIVADLPRSGVVRPVGAALEVRTFAPDDVPADANFALWLAPA